jgi:hypothetical protein
MSGFILLALGNRHISSRKSSHTQFISDGSMVDP